jgi:hypothetical protein
MKKILLILTVALTFLTSCVEPNVEQKRTDFIFDEVGSSFKLIELDGCEYFFYEGGHRLALAHKGNCKNCINNKNK